MLFYEIRWRIGQDAGLVIDWTLWLDAVYLPVDVHFEEPLCEIPEETNEKFSDVDRIGYHLPGGGHATFTSEPDAETWDALNKMIEIAKSK